MTITEHTRNLSFAKLVMRFRHIRYILKLQTNQSINYLLFILKVFSNKNILSLLNFYTLYIIHYTLYIIYIYIKYYYIYFFVQN